MISFCSLVAYTNKLCTLPFVIVVLSLVSVNATLGINKPLFLDSINNSADLFGVAVPIPTCALAAIVPINNATDNNLFFITLYLCL